MACLGVVHISTHSWKLSGSCTLLYYSPQVTELLKVRFFRQKKLGRKEGMANDYGNLGTLYLTRGALKEAEKMYKKSLAIYKSLENKDMIKKVKSWIEELEGLRKEKEK